MRIASTKTNGPQRWDQGATDAQERRFFATTNWIENLIGTLRHVTRNIKRWRDGEMRRRWIGLGLLRAAEGFRRIKHHGELGALVTALGTVTAPERAA